MRTIQDAQFDIHRQALERLPEQSVVSNFQTVLCEDGKTIMMYCHLNDEEALTSSFDLPLSEYGKQFDAAGWERSFEAAFLPISCTVH